MVKYLIRYTVLLLVNFSDVFGRNEKLKVETTIQEAVNGFSITDFITSFEYPVEVHENIETEDGYLLDIVRIPYGRPKIDYSGSTKPVVFLMHGLLGSAENWVISGSEKGLAFLLADRGYDVWMGNARGTVHSRKHVSLDPDSREFWQFSWHEIGVFDLPAKINYILQQTKQTQLTYIGHSQGTTAFFVMASERPACNDKIKLMMALAPVAYMSNVPHPALRIVSLLTRGAHVQRRNNVVQLTNRIGSMEFVPTNDMFNAAGQAFCRKRALMQELCANFMFLVTGYDSDQLERPLIPLIVQTIPAGASIKQLYHYAQGIMSGEFRKYDYGLFNNLAAYGSAIPPSYDLSLITAPVALFFAQNDWLVSTEDVDRLAAELPHVVLKYLVPYEAFNHLDFLFAKDAVSLLYSKVFEIMKEYK